MMTDQPYRYLTVDEMKSLGDDSLPMDVTGDERIDSNRMVTSVESALLGTHSAMEDSISPQHIGQNYAEHYIKNVDNVDISSQPVHVGYVSER